MAAEAMPTPERLRRAAGAFEIGGDRRTGRVIRLMDAPLQRLRADHRLDELDYEALCRLHRHWVLGQLGGAPRAIDYNRVTVHEAGGAAFSERELFHRSMFRLGWGELVTLERLATGAVVLAEVALAEAGGALGYQSPYRARSAILELLRSSANKLATIWKM